MRLQVLHGVRLRRSRDRNELVDAFLLSRVQFIHFFLSFLVVTGVGVVVVLFLSQSAKVVLRSFVFLCEEKKEGGVFFASFFSLLSSFFFL